MISIGILISGSMEERRLLNRVQVSITTEKPVHMPILNGSDFLKPRRLALDMDIILLGPGVTAVMIA